MKKLLIIPAVLAMSSLSGVAFAGGSGYMPSGPSITHSLNTTNSSTLKQSIYDVKAKYGSEISNHADVTQMGAQVTTYGKGCLCKATIKDSFNTKNTSSITQSIKNVSAKDSNIYNSASVLQAGANFVSNP